MVLISIHSQNFPKLLLSRLKTTAVRELQLMNFNEIKIFRIVK